MYSSTSRQESIVLSCPQNSACLDPATQPYQGFFKRFFDLFLCILLLPIIAPVLLLLILIIKIDTPGPGIYKSVRIGKNGKKFNCFKLRTMYQDADFELESLLEKDVSLKNEYKKFRKLKKDPRVTRIGKLLRTFSLDELPQIFNVLKGEMSFVGPRPIVEDEITKYGENFSIYKRLHPGITGLWQVNGRSETPFYGRVEMDTRYIENAGLISDLKILVKTVPAVLSKKGAY